MAHWKRRIGDPWFRILYAYAIGQSPRGTLTDILGGRRVISIGILITAIMFSLFAFAGGYHAAIIIRVLMGFVGAATFVPCMAVLSRWFSKRSEVWC